ncbi:hypothetical protein ES708_26597 [subsurface metagenome]
MKKNKLYLILAVIISLLLFTTGALCNQCGTAVDPLSVGEKPLEEEPLEEEPLLEEEPPEEEPPEEEVVVEEPAEEEPSEEEPPEEELSAPTINLEIYEGPAYSEADGVCYYRVEAKVTGNPSPSVKFSKDDSSGAWGERKSQINLESPSETYTLTATVSNSEGDASDSIEITWGCEVENQDPIISGITLLGTKYTNIQYTVRVSASDPDGDSLTYDWSVTGGTMDDDTANPMKWTTPPEPGLYTITATVSDGKGGEASALSNVDVHFLYDLLAEASDAYWTTGAGHIDFGGPIDDPRGFALYRTDIELEDGNIYSKVLETHPRWINGGWVAGRYASNITIPDGARFTAKVGFIKGATSTDGVGFTIRFYYEGTAHTYDPINVTYDGVLDDMNIDLSLLYGKTGVIQLLVHTGASSAQDWAVWINPQITN